MDTLPRPDPIHTALDHVARMCIDEGFLEEAEQLLVFLEMARLSPYTSGLLRIWARSQRGDLRDALRSCNDMLQRYPDASDVLALMAVLGFACGEISWRATCERLIEMPDCRPESRQVAMSLLDGTFGRKKPAAEVPAEAPAAAQTTAYDVAQSYQFLRG